MYLTLRFDYSTDTLYVPDGYIGDPRTFQAGFLDWLYHNPDYLLCDEKGHAVYHLRRGHCFRIHQSGSPPIRQ